MNNYVFEQMGETQPAPKPVSLPERALAYVADQKGVRTFRVADHLGVKTNVARRIMAQLEIEGRAHRDPHHSAVNDIFWRIGKGRAL